MSALGHYQTLSIQPGESLLSAISGHCNQLRWLPATLNACFSVADTDVGFRMLPHLPRAATNHQLESSPSRNIHENLHCCLGESHRELLSSQVRPQLRWLVEQDHRLPSTPHRLALPLRHRPIRKPTEGSSRAKSRIEGPLDCRLTRD